MRQGASLAMGKKAEHKYVQTISFLALLFFSALSLILTTLFTYNNFYLLKLRQNNLNTKLMPK
jgi:hypothetical protein